MPLPFHSRSHQTVAFGFFNIEIDMLLLEQYFFFADEFCRAVVAIRNGEAPTIDGFVIENRRDVGNVNGAIQRWDLSGFIGATYEEFPFPTDIAQFKQRPNGSRNRNWAKTAIQRFGKKQPIQVTMNAAAQRFAIGAVVFDLDTLTELVNYVDEGGYPRWENEIRPQYVQTMMAKLGNPPGP